MHEARNSRYQACKVRTHQRLQMFQYIAWILVFLQLVAADCWETWVRMIPLFTPKGLKHKLCAPLASGCLFLQKLRWWQLQQLPTTKQGRSFTWTEGVLVDRQHQNQKQIYCNKDWRRKKEFVLVNKVHAFKTINYKQTVTIIYTLWNKQYKQTVTYMWDDKLRWNIPHTWWTLKTITCQQNSGIL